MLDMVLAMEFGNGRHSWAHETGHLCPLHTVREIVGLCHCSWKRLQSRVHASRNRYKPQPRRSLARLL